MEKLGDGAGGCVLKPAVRCGTMERNASSVSKIFALKDSKHAREEYEYITHVLRHVDPENRFTIKPREICQMQSKDILESQCAYKASSANASVTQIVYEYGGFSLEKSKMVHKIECMELFANMHSVFDGLVAFARNKLVHADIKPGNMVFDTKINKAALIDFGAMTNLWDTFYEEQDTQYLLLAAYEYFPPEFNMIAVTVYPDNARTSPDKNILQAMNKVSDTLEILAQDHRHKVTYDILSHFLHMWKERYYEFAKSWQRNTTASSMNRFVDKIDVYGLGISILEVLMKYMKYGNTPEPMHVKWTLMSLVLPMIEPNPKYRASSHRARQIYRAYFITMHMPRESPTQRSRPTPSPIHQDYDGTSSYTSSNRRSRPKSTRRSYSYPRRTPPSYRGGKGDDEKNKTRVVFVYATWCPYCSMMMDAWKGLKSKLKTTDVQIIEIESAKLEAYEKRNPELLKKVRSTVTRLTYPTIVIIRPNGHAHAFKGNRDADTMYKAIVAH
jgi:serine/threonine protein kinase